MLDEKQPSPSCIMDSVPPPDPPLRIMKHGVYTVAYEYPPPPCLISNIRTRIKQYLVSLTHFSYARRLLKDIFLLAPGLSIGCVCATLWLSISDALIIFFLGSIFGFVSDEA
jgi:hypothetical protein